jgi:glycosyltransferase involved in cell wall biosynthesis
VLDVSIVIPTRNADRLIEDCLTSVLASDPREVIVVDGMSSDRTLEIVRRHPVRVLTDEGRGLPAARLIGAEAATGERVVLLDADVVLPAGALSALLKEFEDGRYTALQAGLASVSGPGYWGQALVNHHRNGRSRHWFGLVATIFERAALLQHGFDPRFLSGEDIDLRWRLQQAGAQIGVSTRTVVEHRFAGDDFEFAKGQWLADGHGLGRMFGKHGLRSLVLLGLPFAAAVRGAVLCIGRLQPRWIPYYGAFLLFNYIGMLAELGDLWKRRRAARRSPA